MDINKIFFTRTSPAKKMEIANAMTDNELLAISLDTIKRMIKKVGEKNNYPKGWGKYIRLSEVGNDWNSEIVEVRAFTTKLTLDFYVQYANTDTTISADLSAFLSRGDYRGSIIRSDRFGNPQTYYFTYSQHDKAAFVKAVVLAYLTKKYAARLAT